MKSKFTLIIGFIIITHCLFLFQGCVFFENDQTEYEKNIIGKIKIQKQNNSRSMNLVYAESNEIYAGIVIDCSNVFYDSAISVIYAECNLIENQKTYYKIKVIDPNSKFISDAIKKEKISSLVFSLRIKGLPNIVDVHYNK